MSLPGTEGSSVAQSRPPSTSPEVTLFMTGRQDLDRRGGDGSGGAVPLPMKGLLVQTEKWECHRQATQMMPGHWGPLQCADWTQGCEAR